MYLKKTINVYEEVKYYLELEGTISGLCYMCLTEIHI
jgi:hypothetical protein